MSSRVRVPGGRRRSLALVVAVALAGAPVLAGSPAGAGPAGTVTFHGGCGLLGSGLGAWSSPDTDLVNLLPGTGLRFVNRLGRAATLRLDGEAAADIPPGGTADVTFHAGPVRATMQISCLLGTPAGGVTVEVFPAPRVVPGQPAASPPGAGVPAGRGDGASPGAPAYPAGPDRPGGPADPGEAAAGSPPVTGPGPADELSQRWGLATDPLDRGGGSAGPARVEPPAAGAVRTGEQLARTSGSAPGDRPNGLLTLAAIGCLVGVSVGAVKAVIGRRATPGRGGLNQM